MKTSLRAGFTLIELLIVIAIIAILAAAVFVALDPVQRFQEARDSARWSDVNNIISAVKTDQVDNGGAYLAAVAGLTAGNFYTIGTDATACDAGCTAKVTQAACVDLTGLVTEGYLGEVPQDPSSGTAAKTDYYLSRKASGTVEVGSCDPEAATTITISR
ncbi:MAG: prepilin-type N-terminal cleavage/methylation domain-containing protein [Patescibacteria group bacterium]